MHSKDHELGKRVHQLLLRYGLENPILETNITAWQDIGYVRKLEDKLADFLTSFGLDLTGDSMCKTPNRVIKFFINELFYGLDYKNFPAISMLPNNFAYHSPLVSQGITVNSSCEHHLVSIQGEAVVAYLPGKHIVGLSKLNRVVDFFARRPQVQERLTRQIFVTLQEVLDTADVLVAINATHDCIVSRGTQDNGTKNLTLETGGRFITDLGLKNCFQQMLLAR